MASETAVGMTDYSRDELISAFISRGYADAEIARELYRLKTAIQLGFVPRGAEFVAVIRHLLKKVHRRRHLHRPGINVPPRNGGGHRVGHRS